MEQPEGHIVPPVEALEGKVAVVTGAASGIGRALATRFAAEGMRVVLADVEEPALEAAVDALRSEGAKAIGVPTDVSKGDQVDALAAAALAAFGSYDVVCNNAGVGGGAGPCWTLTEADWRWTLDVNLWGVLHGIRALVPPLVEQGTGHVVNTASMAGLLTGPFMGPYMATKHAVVAVSEVLLADLQVAGSAVGVSVLCPGFVSTNITDSGRNRPAELADTATVGVLGDDTAGWELFRALIAGGMDPAEVAGKVVEAIKADRFYIYTHPDLVAAAASRHRAIEEGVKPGAVAPEGFN